MPQISVIVPVYNVENYLHRCVDSILAQTFTDFELILVNDGSTDDSGRICNEYANKDKRIIVVHQNNQGQAAARNNAVKLSNCEWIHFVDSDDLIHPKMLEFLYNGAINNNVNISMCNLAETPSPLDLFSSEKQCMFFKKDVNEDFFLEIYKTGCHKYGTVVAKLIKKSIIQSVPFENDRIYEDTAVVCRWLQLSRKVADAEESLYWYFSNTNGTTKSEFSVKRLDNLWALKQTLKFHREHKYFNMLQKIFIAYMNIAVEYYDICSKVLRHKNAARTIKKDMRQVYKLYRNIIELDLNFNEYICFIMYPNQTRLHCYFNKIKRILNTKS